MEPVIDIGCGKSGRIVKYLRSKGIAAFGLDRLNLPNDVFFIRGSWFEYNFEKDHWGSVISNMGFANHFVGNHLRKDGNYIEYAEKYNEILNALKIGGSFYYAPGLPFIEQYLSKDRFVVDNEAIHGKINLTRSIVRKIK